MRSHSFSLTIGLGAALAAVASACIAHAQPGAGTPAPQPSAPTPSPIPDPDPNQKMETTIRVIAPPPPPTSTPVPSRDKVASADDLLLVLEHAGKDLRTFQADLRKTKFFDEIQGGGTHEQGGTLIFVSEPITGADGQPLPPPAPLRRKFAVTFTHTIFDGKTRNNDEQTFIFDGEWLTEKNAAAKQLHKRQVVPPGQILDPLAVGEGPFPLPIGQKRDRILERFDAELLAPEAFEHFQGGKFPEVLKETWQLRLTPKAEYKRDYQLTEARIWYRKDNLLPRMAWTKEKDGSTNEYFLSATRENEAVPAAAFDVRKPDGWTEQVDVYRREKTDQ